MKHSQGPWVARPANPEERTHVETREGELVCFVEGHGFDHHQDFANAVLISQAPTLLKAVKLALMEFERIAYQKKANPEIIKSLKRAVELAEGNSN